MLTPYSYTDIDLSTKEGKKDYEKTTEKLAILFDGKTNTHEWMTVFSDRIDERGLRHAFRLNIDGKPIDLLVQPGLVTMAKLKAYCTVIWGPTGIYQEQIAHQMIGILIRRSVSPIIRQRLEQDKNDWFLPAREGICGLIIFKKLLEYSGKTSQYGIDAIKTQLIAMRLDQFEKQNVSLALQARNRLKDELTSLGEPFQDDFFHLQRLLQSCGVPKFVTYIEGLESQIDDGLLFLTANELANKAEKKFKLLSDKNLWKIEDLQQQLFAMHAALKTLAISGAVTSNSEPIAPHGKQRRTKQDNEWKFQNDSKAATLAKDGKTFHWCTGKDTKNHPAMWCLHEPDTCTAQKATENKVKGDTAKADKETKDTKPAPKLQPNKALQAALAALNDKMRSGLDDDTEDSQKHESG
jgi:hypothetical protein